MCKSKYLDGQTLAILMQSESGVSVPDLCSEHGMNSARFYIWRYGRFSDEWNERTVRENKRLKKMYAGERLKAENQHEAREENCKAISA